MLKKLYTINRGNHYALVSRKNPKKVLKHFGKKKPSQSEINKEERRVNYFKHKG